MRIAGAIIAGGRSSRMQGAEKIFLEVGERPIVDRIISCLKPQVDQLVINAGGEAGRFSFTGLAVVPDLAGHLGTPLAGIHACLAWAMSHGFEAVVTVPSDTPFLPGDLVSRLASLGGLPAIAVSAGQSHYVTGLWPTSSFGELDRAIGGNTLRRVQDWAALVHAGLIEWPAVPFDPFFNVNTPTGLAEANRIAAEFRP